VLFTRIGVRLEGSQLAQEELDAPAPEPTVETTSRCVASAQLANVVARARAVAHELEDLAGLHALQELARLHDGPGQDTRGMSSRTCAATWPLRPLRT